MNNLVSIILVDPAFWRKEIQGIKVKLRKPHWGFCIDSFFCGRLLAIILCSLLTNKSRHPTLCQLYVSRALRPLKEQHPHLYVIHYLDDILIATSKECDLHAGLQTLDEGLQWSDLVVAPEKMQTMFLFQYLGHQLLWTGA